MPAKKVKKVVKSKSLIQKELVSTPMAWFIVAIVAAIGIYIYVQANAGGLPNLVKNPSFEKPVTKAANCEYKYTSSTTWQVCSNSGGSSKIVSSSTALDGKKVLQLSAGSKPGANTHATQSIRVTPGCSYSVTAFARSISGQPPLVASGWAIGNKPLNMGGISPIDQPVKGLTDWKYQIGGGGAGAGANRLIISLVVESGSVAQFDSISVTPEDCS